MEKYRQTTESTPARKRLLEELFQTQSDYDAYETVRKSEQHNNDDDHKETVEPSAESSEDGKDEVLHLDPLLQSFK